MELHQKSLLEKRTFFLLPNKLKIYVKNTEGEQEDYVTYESLKGEARVAYCKNPNLLFFTIATVSCSVSILINTLFTNQDLKLVIFPIALSILFATLYQTQQQKYTTIETFDRRTVVFLHNKPDSRTLGRFLNQLWSKRRKYLREKYFYISRHDEREQQTNRLRWLLEQNAITKAEFKLAQEDWIIDKSCKSKLR